MSWLIFEVFKWLIYGEMSRFSEFDMDPEYHVEDMDFDRNDDFEGDFDDNTVSDYIPSPREIEEVELENTLENADDMLSPKDHTNSTMVCRVPPQGSYDNGRLMCSICSTLLGLCISNGVMPDPGTISPMLCIQLIGSIMERSSKLQGEYMMNMNEMKQISEVLSIIDREGMVVMLSPDMMTECFGPLDHGHILEVVAPTEGFLVKGLDKVLDEDVGVNDGIVVTTKGHSVYMMKVEDGMYVFDPLYGSLDKVSGDARNVWEYMGYGNEKKSITGLENDKMYTGMIMRKLGKEPKLEVVVDTPPTQQLQQPISEPYRCTKNKVQIMEDATKVLESMRGEHGSAVVQALRIQS